MSKNNTTISGHHIEITPAIESTVNTMIEKLKHKFDHIITVHVTLKIDPAHPHLQHAEAKLTLQGKKEPIFAQASSDDMYKSIHLLKDKLDHQIIKHKEIIKNHGKHANHHGNHDNKNDE